MSSHELYSATFVIVIKKESPFLSPNHTNLPLHTIFTTSPACTVFISSERDFPSLVLEPLKNPLVTADTRRPSETAHLGWQTAIIANQIGFIFHCATSFCGSFLSPFCTLSQTPTSYLNSQCNSQEHVTSTATLRIV